MKYENILEAIGRTPLVRINRIFKQYPIEVWAKCEFMNPGGSVKDRIGYQMVIDAEKAGRIKRGDTLIEPTSGNTGIGIAMAGAVLGYKVVITLPEKMSREKQVVLEALGAEIIRTPTEAAWDSPESHIGVAKKLQKLLPNAHILDQYGNMSNPRVHAECTAMEIVQDLGGVPDVLVATAGTGGTISGVAQKFKELRRDCQIVGVDPEGSILGGGTDIHSYHVEGIGYDFFPEVLDRKIIDRWIKTTDEPSFKMARRIICEEGMLVGGSSGACLYALETIAPTLKPGTKVVVILADSVRNYMTKFIDNKWLDSLGFSSAKGEPLRIAHKALGR